MLTLLPEPAPAFSLLPKTLPDASPGLALKRVLIIDDSAASTRLTRWTLEKIAAWNILELNQSSMALDTAKAFRPNLILLDVEMPGLDGATVWRQLRADQDLRLVPIIFLTSLITEAEAAIRRFDGNTRVLAKPLTLAKLSGFLAAHLGDLCAGPRPNPHPAP